MSPPLIRQRDLAFILYEVLDVLDLCRRPRFAEHGRETFDAAIETATAIAGERFAPLNARLDREEPHFDGQRVHILPEVRTALDAFIGAGFMAAHRDEGEGGMQLPVAVAQACYAQFQAASPGITGYPFLTIAAANLIAAHGSQWQKSLYMAPMVEGRFFGTMCLSEPQAGSSLSDIRTTAEPTADGEYRITGSKMWISAGEHELAENIVHLVLAKIRGGPPGVKGISLFIVPKRLVGADGTLGPRNDVQLVGLNHKMGFRGTTNTLLSFGEQGRCIGYLLGAPNHGLAYMFHMMNEARIGVGLGAVALGYAGFVYSLGYAKERPQGRLPENKDPTAPPVPIAEHADVRRMLLAQKSYVEGGLALCLYAARLVDEQQTGTDATAREEAGLLLDILTPVVKAWCADWCLEANRLAIQVLGGYGYTRDYPVEQFYRDNRLNPIHEGTNGIQAIDLLGRKVTMQNGAAFRLLCREIAATIQTAGSEPDLAEHCDRLAAALAMVEATTAALLPAARDGRLNLYLANASVYAEMLGHVVVAWMWLRQAAAAARGLGNGATGEEALFYQGKLAACRYFFRYELPKTEPQADLLARLEPCLLETDPAVL